MYWLLRGQYNTTLTMSVPRRGGIFTVIITRRAPEEQHVSPSLALPKVPLLPDLPDHTDDHPARRNTFLPRLHPLNTRFTLVFPYPSMCQIRNFRTCPR